MQETFQKLTSEWVALSDFITVDADKKYRIQNRGADVLIALESSSEPDADNYEGTNILPYFEAEYVKGEQDLYLRAYNVSCSVNITSEG
jgi:hypothetical protein